MDLRDRLKSARGPGAWVTCQCSASQNRTVATISNGSRAADPRVMQATGASWDRHRRLPDHKRASA